MKILRLLRVPAIVVLFFVVSIATAIAFESIGNKHGIKTDLGFTVCSETGLDAKPGNPAHPVHPRAGSYG